MTIAHKVLAAIVVAGIAAGTSAASAAFSDPDSHATESLRTLFAGSTVYTDDFTFNLPRTDVLRFRPDGAVTTNFTKTRHVSGMRVIEEYGRDIGQWSVRDGALCLQFQKQLYGEINCYRIEPRGKGVSSVAKFRAVNIAGRGDWRFRLQH